MPRRPSATRSALAALVLATIVLTPAQADEPESRLLTFGGNWYGQAGDGTQGGPRPLAEIEGMSDVVAVAAGGYHALALRADGRVYAWGDNRQGQLGDGTLIQRNAPQLVPDLTHVVQIGAGGSFSLAIRSDGSVWEWGSRATEDPANALPPLLTPTRVDGLTGVALDGGVGHRVVATSAGEVIAWGYNGGGQLGDGTAVDRWHPVPMDGSVGVVAVTGGLLHSAVLFDDGGVAAVGGNAYGQLGDGSFTDRLELTRINDLDDVVEISSGDAHTLAMLADGTVQAWGHQIGLGTPDTGMGTDRPTPGPVPGLAEVTAVRAGSFNSMAITPAGLWSWGWTTGVDGASLSDVPVFLEGTAGATDAAPGNDFGVILIHGVPLALPEPVGTTASVTATPTPDSAGDDVTFTVTIAPAPDSGIVSMGPDASTVTHSAPVDPATGTATFSETIAAGPAAAARHFRFSGAPGFLPSDTSLALDTHGPTVGSQTAALPAGVTTPMTSIPVAIAWVGVDALTGVAEFEMEEAMARGASGARATVSASTVTRQVTPGRTFRYRIRGVDHAGNQGPWTAPTALHVQVIDDRDPRPRIEGAWTKMAAGQAWGGSAYSTTTPGARISATVGAGAIGWLAAVGPDRSKVNVYVDGVRVRTVDLYAPTQGWRRVMIGGDWPTDGTHTLMLANVGTAGRARFDLDAFVVLTRP